jgi:hypothetical protein
MLLLFGCKRMRAHQAISVDLGTLKEGLAKVVEAVQQVAFELHVCTIPSSPSESCYFISGQILRNTRVQQIK